MIRLTTEFKKLITTPLPDNETQRLNALHSYGILNTGKEVEFDQITKLASQITKMPISLISFVDSDKVWFKSATGMDIEYGDRSLSFCGHAVGSGQEVFMIENILEDDRFHDHPYANLPKNPILFYAGVCLTNEDGHALGTLCVIDNKPNSLNQEELNSLKMLAKQVEKLIELHKMNQDLSTAQDLLEEKNQDLMHFAGRVSHDMKMPLANMIVTADILKAKYGDDLNEEATKYINYLKDSSFSLSDYISGMLAHYESDSIAERKEESFDLMHLLEEIVELLNIDNEVEINFPELDHELNCNRAALEQIFLNLIGNSLKYNDKDIILINIDCKQQGDMYHFSISDNGIGIPEDKINSIFDLFSTVGNLDRQGRKGNGIGLSTVKKLVTKLGGEIGVESELGKGTTFSFSVKGK